jgi:hypothetical protein
VAAEERRGALERLLAALEHDANVLRSLLEGT